MIPWQIGMELSLTANRMTGPSNYRSLLDGKQTSNLIEFKKREDSCSGAL